MQHGELAQQALRAYALAEPQVSFLGHHDTLTFHVVDGLTQAPLLLRLHSPATAALRSPRQQPDMIWSELQWLEALTQETSLLVPRPVRTRAGELFTTLAFEQGTVVCSLLHWTLGDPFPQAPSSHQAAQLGQVLATLHLQARAWSPPQPFVRPRYDLAFYARQMEGCAQVVQEGLLPQPAWKLLQQTLEQLFTELSAKPLPLLVIHADLHRGNLLVAGSQVCPIDFAFCGWGSPLFDVGTALLGIPPSLRAVALQAYQERISLPADASRLLDAYSLLSRMGAYLFLLAEPAERAWLRERLPRFVAQECQRFLQRDSVLFGE